ncbi:EamA-like transporter family protein [Roseovarius halotolerans]|uniref:EamA-like transporter family protein n=1 Tax=Roseovarius halotolerans TaxID=505353 RepID=A0A1X6Y8C6_9RHOB|nr:DMT family transporter [Roseovarius halotolerans]RKT35126.1 EamA-like transporter family protein [Roseovarius halotolerans]SLN13437.1 EamA-like transporter family protein [Roseovarius halotolerans]
MTRHPLFGILLAAFGTLVLTPDTMFMRWSEMNGFEMVAWRGLLMGTAMLTAWAILSRNRRGDLRVLVSGFGLTIVACQFANASLFALGISLAPVAVVLFGLATVPVFSAVLAWMILGEPTRIATWLTIFAVMTGIGIAVLSGDKGEVGLNPASLLGALFGLGTAIALALNFVVIRRRPQLPILLVIGTGAVLAGLSGLSIAGPAAMTDGNVWAIAVTGLVILPVSFFTLSLASRFTHASNVSLLLLLETVLGPAWVWLGTGEAPTPMMILGGALVVGSLALYILWTGQRASRARRAR